METQLALAHIAESRPDFYAVRRPLIAEELQAVAWLRQEFAVVESTEIRSEAAARNFARCALQAGAPALVVHLPVWGDPIFTVKLANLLPLPVLLLGNDRPDTSSLVGILGAGGALDQIGRRHLRVFEHHSDPARRRVRAFVRAANAVRQLRGQKLGLFGGRSLGIFTAVADPAQWQRLFGVDIEYLDQAEIVQTGAGLPGEEVSRHLEWLGGRLGGIRHGGLFTEAALERQMRSYLATRQLYARHELDFVGVKCQPELSDGYATQCVAHLLLNSGLDADGEAGPVVHACESDADGALTMQILHLLAGGRPAALLDIRWYDRAKGLWTLANCGAVPAAFFATPEDPSGLSELRMEPHVFGLGGGGALPGVVAPQAVTLARLCRRDGVYWMAIVAGETVRPDPQDIGRTTAAFPKAFVRAGAGPDFLENFGSNHIHLVSGDLTEELITFCRLVGLEWQIWR